MLRFSLAAAGVLALLLAAAENRRCPECRDFYMCPSCNFRCPERYCRHKCRDRCNHRCNQCLDCKNCCDCFFGCKCQARRRDQARMTRERQEQERREQERREQERKDQERKEQEKKEQERREKERREQERKEQERREQEKREQESKEQERRERERQEKNREAAKADASSSIHTAFEKIKIVSSYQQEEISYHVCENSSEQKNFSLPLSLSFSSEEKGSLYEQLPIHKKNIQPMPKLSSSKLIQPQDIDKELMKYMNDIESHIQVHLHSKCEQDLIPVIKSKLLQSCLEVQASVCEYFKKGGKLYLSVVKDLPIEEWIVTCLCNDLIRGLLPHEDEFSLEDFSNNIDQLKAHYEHIDVEKLLFALREKQNLHELPLSVINDILVLLLDSDSHKLLFDDDTDWLFKLKSRGIHMELNKLGLPYSPSTKRHMSEKIASLDASLQTVDLLLKGIRADTKESDVEDLVTLVLRYNVEVDKLSSVLRRQDKCEVGNTDMFKYWYLQLQTALLTENSAYLLEENAILLEPVFMSLLEQGCSYDSIHQLMDQTFVTDANFSLLKEVLHLLADYQADRDTCTKAFACLEEFPPIEWLPKVNNLLLAATFTKDHEYSVAEIIDYIAKRAPDIPFCSEESLFSYYQQVMDAYKQPSHIIEYLEPTAPPDLELPTTKPICNWNKEDLKYWATCVRRGSYGNWSLSQEDLLRELICGVKQGVQLHYHYPPRATQLLSVILLLNSEQGRGRLAQVPTGEGKSLIIAMLAVVHALLGRTVDVVTVSTELSVPEVEKQAEFFDVFCLSVGENCDFCTKYESYEKDIVYGTAGTFQADILQTEFYGKPIRGERGFDVVLVDEVDSMLFDQRSQSTHLCEGLPAMDHLEVVLGTIWCHLDMTRGHITPSTQKDNKFLFVAENFRIDEQGNVHTESGQPVDDCGIELEDPMSFLKETTLEHIQKVLRTLSDEEEVAKKESEDKYARAITLTKEIALLEDELKTKINSCRKDEAHLIANQQEKIQTSLNNVQDLTTEYENLQSQLRKLNKDMEQLEQEVDAEMYKKKQSKIQELPSISQFLKTCSWTEHHPVLDVPRHLQEFARHQIPYWINSALDALFAYKVNKHYIVERGKIVPIHYNDTGVFQPNMVWGNGLSQFLQIKEGLKIHPESLATNYLSTYGFFKRYGTHLYGVTGTLGEKEQSFFENIYGTDQVIIPPYIYQVLKHSNSSSYMCKEFPARVFSDQTVWYDTICTTSIMQAKLQRSVLIICKFLSEVESIAQYLEDTCCYPGEKILTYTGKKDEFCQKKLSAGDILLATNIAGRGTDLSLTSEVEENGGLHVCITFLPQNFRVELQNVGRTGRKGKKGTAQLLIYNAEGISIQVLKKNRDTYQTEAFEKAISDVDNIDLQDRLFVKFCALLRSLVPSLCDVQKSKERHDIEVAYELEEEAVDEESLKVAFSQHVEGIVSEQLCRLEEDPYTQYPASEREILKDEARTVIEQAGEKYQDTEFSNWKKLQENERFKIFCSKWEGKVSNEVMESFRCRTPYLIQEAAVPGSITFDHYDRLGLTEQWALWRHQSFSPDNPKIESEILASFESFCKKMKEQAKAGEVIQNPYYYVQRGNWNLDQGNVPSAIQCYENAIKKDEKWSLYAHVNLPRAYLSCKPVNREEQFKAKEHCEAALSLIDNVYRPNLLQLHTLTSLTQGTSETGQVQSRETTLHIRHQMDILSITEEQMQEAIQVIDEALKQDKEVEVNEKTSLQHILKTANLTHDYSQALREVNLNGLTHLITPRVKNHSLYWSVLGMTLLGTCQIVAGSLITVYTGNRLGFSLIHEGVSDLFVALRAVITGSFNWAAWAIEKVQNVTMSLISAGFNTVKNHCGVIQNTFKSMQQTKELTEDIKFGIGVAAKQIALSLGKGAARECLNLLYHSGAEKLLMEKIDKMIAEPVQKKIKAFLEKNELVKEALSVDVQNGNNHFQKLFIEDGVRLLEKKDDNNIALLKGIVEMVIKDYIQSTEVLFHVTALSKIAIDLTTFTDNFLDSLSKEVEKHRDDIERASALLKEKTTQDTEMNPEQQGIFQTVSSPQRNLDEIKVDFCKMRPGQSYSTSKQHTTNCFPSDLNNLVTCFSRNIQDKLSCSISSYISKLPESLYLRVDAMMNETYKSIEQQRIKHEAVCKLNIEGMKLEQ